MQAISRIPTTLVGLYKPCGQLMASISLTENCQQ